MSNLDLSYYEEVLGVLPKELNETYLVNLVKKCYDEIDFVKVDASKFIYSSSLLEYYLRSVCFATFEETEDIYRFAKDICIRRNRLMNEWRSELMISSITFKDWLIKRKIMNKNGEVF